MLKNKLTVPEMRDLILSGLEEEIKSSSIEVIGTMVYNEINKLPLNDFRKRRIKAPSYCISAVRRVYQESLNL